MEEIKQNCPCKKISCERHGNCEACKEHHSKLSGNRKTACERIKAKEKNGERNI